MRKRNGTSYAILGLLALREWTTYELAKQVQRSLTWFWPRAERKLYDEPKRLVEEGLAVAQREQTGRRGRTVYRITDEGRDALAAWLGEAPAPRSSEFEGMMKVFFADAGSKEQLLATLRHIADDAGQRLSTLAAMAAEPGAFPHRRHLQALTLRLQQEQEQAVERWTRWATEQVAQWPAADDPGAWDAGAVLEQVADTRR